MSWRLTRGDSLAWEAQPREMTAGRQVIFLLWLALGGLWVLLLPRWLVPEGSLLFYACMVAAAGVQYGLATVWLTWRAHRRARRRVPLPVRMRLEDRAEGLRVGPEGAGDGTLIAPAMIRQVVVTPGHVFIDTPRDVVIVPLRAFRDVGEMRAFAERWDEAAKQAAA
ncbi:hypothetical protein RNZ50_05685 [Paracoccaceae bacterium Fryx2]|nr:hypothetical protein [Paracoccaceae bacterium Fryx2]